MTFTGGTTIGVVGVTSTGKSTFLRSAAEVGKTVVAISPSDEDDSYLGSEVVREIFMDPEWRPRDGAFQATAWLAHLKWLRAARKDATVRIIGFDTASVLADLAWHEALKPHAVDDPSKLGANWGAPWQAFGGLMDEWFTEIALARHAGKVVVALWHGELRETEGVGEATVKQSRQGEEVHWGETLMPRIRGSIRQSVPSKFSLWMRAGVTVGPETKRFLTVGSDKTMLARSRIALHGGPKFPNSLKAVLAAMEPKA